MVEEYWQAQLDLAFADIDEVEALRWSREERIIRVSPYVERLQSYVEDVLAFSTEGIALSSLETDSVTTAEAVMRLVAETLSLRRGGGFGTYPGLYSYYKSRFPRIAYRNLDARSLIGCESALASLRLQSAFEGVSGGVLLFNHFDYFLDKAGDERNAVVREILRLAAQGGASYRPLLIVGGSPRRLREAIESSELSSHVVSHVPAPYDSPDAVVDAVHGILRQAEMWWLSVEAEVLLRQRVGKLEANSMDFTRLVELARRMAGAACAEEVQKREGGILEDVTLEKVAAAIDEYLESLTARGLHEDSTRAGGQPIPDCAPQPAGSVSGGVHQEEHADYQEERELWQVPDSRLSKLLQSSTSEIDFRLDPSVLCDIHRYLFDGLSPFSDAGEYRVVQLARAESMLHGAGVRYEHPENIPHTLAEAFEREKRAGLAAPISPDDIARLADLIVTLWKAAPFRYGNSRVLLAFIHLYLSSRTDDVRPGKIEGRQRWLSRALTLAAAVRSLPIPEEPVFIQGFIEEYLAQEDRVFPESFVGHVEEWSDFKERDFESAYKYWGTVRRMTLLPSTPKVLQNLGIPDLPIMVNVDMGLAVERSKEESGADPNRYPIHFIELLPLLVAHPAAVHTVPQSGLIKILLSDVDHLGRPVVVTLVPARSTRHEVWLTMPRTVAESLKRKGVEPAEAPTSAHAKSSVPQPTIAERWNWYLKLWEGIDEGGYDSVTWHDIVNDSRSHLVGMLRSVLQRRAEYDGDQAALRDVELELHDVEEMWKAVDGEDARAMRALKRAYDERSQEVAAEFVDTVQIPGRKGVLTYRERQTLEKYAAGLEEDRRRSLSTLAGKDAELCAAFASTWACERTMTRHLARPSYWGEEFRGPVDELIQNGEGWPLAWEFAPQCVRCKPRLPYSPSERAREKIEGVVQAWEQGEYVTPLLLEIDGFLPPSTL